MSQLGETHGAFSAAVSLFSIQLIQQEALGLCRGESPRLC